MADYMGSVPLTGTPGNVLMEDAPGMPPAFRPHGYPLSYGGNLNGLGDFADVNGLWNTALGAALDAGNQAVLAQAGTLRSISWASVAADATTMIKIHVNAVVVQTIALTGASGTITGLSTVVGAAGDLVAVEYDAGTMPGNTNLQLYWS